MTLEALFAQAAQGRTFLLMALLGAALALCVQLSGYLHRWRRWLGMLADLLTALGLALAAGRILFQGGEMRLYALLGLTIGGLLYAAGPGKAVGWGIRRAIGRNARQEGEKGSLS